MRIAEECGGVIINADSRQLYRPLRILTARPTEAEMQRVPHALYGMLEGDAPCSAGAWLQLARMEIDWARARGATPVVAGGTGLYLKALMEGIADIPATPPQTRAAARADWEAMGSRAFHARLAEIDPLLASRLTPGDTQRNLRGYEVWMATGKPLSWWQAQGKAAPYGRNDFEIVSVMPERAELYARCNARFDAMLAAGALAEVKTVLESGLAPEAPVMNIIGVPELSAHLRGEHSLEEAAARARQATRNYAKRQLTWFRHQLPP